MSGENRVAALSRHLCIGESSNREAPERKSKIDRLPIKIAFSDKSAADERYGGSGDVAILEGELLRLKNGPPKKCVLIFMHPSGIQNLLPMPVALAKAGCHVVTCTSRYPNNDSALQMEKCAIDLGEVIKYCKRRLAYEKIVLCGWSGGGSLSTFYQAQATKCTVFKTPGGDAVDLSKLPKADALLCLAAHSSRARIFTEWLDPAVLDENDVSIRDKSLDLWGEHPDCRPPFSKEFVAKFRAAQVARNRKITAWCEAQLASGMRSENSHSCGRRDRSFVVQCTQADLRRLDLSIDPNGRPPTTLTELSSENHSPVGLARFTTLRSWLSQWSIDRSNADGLKSMRSIDVPVLVLANGDDHLVPTSHPESMFASVSHGDKEFVVIEGASHYYFGQPEEKAKGVKAIIGFLESRGFRP